MKFIPFKKFGKSLLRIVFLLTVILGSAALCYLLWNPGRDTPLPDYSDNAIWIGHGWLGDDAWFERKQIDRADFRSEANIVGTHQQSGIRERVGALGERRNNPQQPVGTSGVRFPGQRGGLHKCLCRRHDPDQAVFDQQRQQEDRHDPGNRCRGFPLG